MGSLDPTCDSYENLKTTKPYNECDHTERFSVSTDVELEEIQVKGVSGGDNGDNVPLTTLPLSKGALRRLKEREKLERFEEAVERIDFLVRWAHCLVLVLLAIFIIFMVVKFGIKDRGNIPISDAEVASPLEE